MGLLGRLPDAHIREFALTLIDTGALATELWLLGEPVDLVGHDWGAALTYRIAQTRPGLLRSWAADALYLLHPDYFWHDLAQTWQTRRGGSVLGQLSRPAAAQVAAAFAPWAVDPDDELARRGRGAAELNTFSRSLPDPARTAPGRQP